MRQKETNISALPKLRSYTNNIDNNYSNSFKLIFNNALDSVQKKQMMVQSRNKLKTTQRTREYHKSYNKVSETLKQQYSKFTLPPMTFLSKILRASRKSTIVTPDTNYHKTELLSSCQRSKQLKESFVVKRKNGKMSNKKQKKIFFKNVQENPKENNEQMFRIEPWFDDQLFSKRF